MIAHNSCPSSPDDGVPPPSSKITDVEDAFQKNRSSGGTLGLDNLQISAKFPVRPGYGTKGEKVTLWANYFELIPNPDLLLYRYNVSVAPEAKGKLLSQVIRLLLGLPEYVNFQRDIVTDFKSTLISHRRFSPDMRQATIQYRSEGEDEPPINAKTYQVRVEETGTFTVSDLTDYLASTNVSTTYTEKLPLLQAFNIFLSHYAKSSPAIATAGSSKSFSLTQASAKWDLGAGLFAIRGFFSSVRVAACRILVNINVSHGAFYDAIPLGQLIQRYGSANKFDIVKLQKFLGKLRVRLIHLKEKKNKAGEVIPKVKTICALANRNDGHRLEHPPRVAAFGAGPKDVEFFLDDSPKEPPSSTPSQDVVTSGGKKKAKGNPKNISGRAPGKGVAQAGRYISVYDFFKISMDFHAPFMIQCRSNQVNSLWSIDRRAKITRRQRGQQRKSRISPGRSLHCDAWTVLKFTAGSFPNAADDSLCCPQAMGECKFNYSRCTWYCWHIAECECQNGEILRFLMGTWDTSKLTQAGSIWHIDTHENDHSSWPGSPCAKGQV
jgi:eukaryotic translation initiation factor 2C